MENSENIQHQKWFMERDCIPLEKSWACFDKQRIIQTGCIQFKTSSAPQSGGGPVTAAAAWGGDEVSQP